ncbi:MAG: M48 family metallopeptidase [bacterium]|nr:M48 family metallopeptidase [bacterium]
MRKFAVEREKVLLPESIHCPALEEEWPVHYHPTASPTVQARCNGNGTLVVSGNTADEPAVRKALLRWLGRAAKESLVPWIAELAEISGLSYQKVTIRGQRTRWGSCSTTGTISLNFRLLFLEPDLVRYVLHHELCHTVYPNHSRDFWAMLETVEPDCRALGRAVRGGMKVVPEWAKNSPKCNVQNPKWTR